MPVLGCSESIDGSRRMSGHTWSWELELQLKWVKSAGPPVPTSSMAVPATQHGNEDGDLPSAATALQPRDGTHQPRLHSSMSAAIVRRCAAVRGSAAAAAHPGTDGGSLVAVVAHPPPAWRPHHARSFRAHQEVRPRVPGRAQLGRHQRPIRGAPGLGRARAVVSRPVVRYVPVQPAR